MCISGGGELTANGPAKEKQSKFDRVTSASSDCEYQKEINHQNIKRIKN